MSSSSTRDTCEGDFVRNLLDKPNYISGGRNERIMRQYIHACSEGRIERARRCERTTDSGRVVWAHEVSHRTKVVGIRKMPEQIAIYGLP